MIVKDRSNAVFDGYLHVLFVFKSMSLSSPQVEEKKVIEKNVEPKPAFREEYMEREAPVSVQKARFQPLREVSRENLPSNIDLIMDVNLDISVVLGRTKKSIKDILALGNGSLIELDRLAEEPVEILVNGKRIAYGEVVVVDENFGVRITSIVSNEDRIKTLSK